MAISDRIEALRSQLQINKTIKSILREQLRTAREDNAALVARCDELVVDIVAKDKEIKRLRAQYLKLASEQAWWKAQDDEMTEYEVTGSVDVDDTELDDIPF